MFGKIADACPPATGTDTGRAQSPNREARGVPPQVCAESGRSQRRHRARVTPHQTPHHITHLLKSTSHGGLCACYVSVESSTPRETHTPLPCARLSETLTPPGGHSQSGGATPLSFCGSPSVRICLGLGLRLGRRCVRGTVYLAML